MIPLSPIWLEPVTMWHKYSLMLPTASVNLADQMFTEIWWAARHALAFSPSDVPWCWCVLHGALSIHIWVCVRKWRNHLEKSCISKLHRGGSFKTVSSWWHVPTQLCPSKLFEANVLIKNPLLFKMLEENTNMKVVMGGPELKKKKKCCADWQVYYKD